MTQQELTQTVAKNLVMYRKHNNLTQIQLAEKLNYSDKAVSKWERGEALPDVYVLKCIADFYGITLNDLLSKRTKPKMSFSKLRAFFVPLLSVCIVWLVAVFTFFVWTQFAPFYSKRYLTFIVAIPISAIVLLVFAGVFKNDLWQFICISILIWTSILSFHLILNEILPYISMLYFIGIPIQSAFIFWYIYKAIIKSKTKKQIEKNEIETK